MEEFSDSWISSNERPFVSGTTIATNTMVAALAAEKMKKVPVEQVKKEQVFILLNYTTKRKVKVQLYSVIRISGINRRRLFLKNLKLFTYYFYIFFIPRY